MRFPNCFVTRWCGKTYSYDPNGNLLPDGTHSVDRFPGCPG
jgi:hypothetical protein